MLFHLQSVSAVLCSYRKVLSAKPFFRQTLLISATQEEFVVHFLTLTQNIFVYFRRLLFQSKDNYLLSIYLMIIINLWDWTFLAFEKYSVPSKYKRQWENSNCFQSTLRIFFLWALNPKSGLPTIQLGHCGNVNRSSL